MPLCHLAGSDFTSVIGVMVQSQEIRSCYRLNSHVASELATYGGKILKKRINGRDLGTIEGTQILLLPNVPSIF